MFLARAIVAPNPASKFIADSGYFQIIIHIFIMALLAKIYIFSKGSHDRVFIWFLVYIFGLFLGDITWYTILHYKGSNIYPLSFDLTVINALPFAVWIFGITMFLGKILNRYALLKTNKTQITFLYFVMSTISFLIFFVLAYAFSVINKAMFFGIPLFVTVYSTLTILISLKLGSYFEIPFKQLSANIDNLINNKPPLYPNFITSEFEFLQKTIENSFAYKNENDRIRHEFGVIAANVAHDIASPLTALTLSIDNIKSEMTLSKVEKHLPLIEKLIQNIRNISKSIVTSYYNVTRDCSDTSQFDDENTPRYVILDTLLASFVESKKMEWQNNVCIITYYNFSATNLRQQWVYIAPTKFIRTLSNITNNAYQSLKNGSGKIEVSLAITGENFIIKIKDNGCGIPRDKIAVVLNGLSTKHEGKGLGLMNATEYFNSINGHLTLESDLTLGTTATIFLPLSMTPLWFNKEIYYSKKSTLVILDDDINIIVAWQSISAFLVFESKKYCVHVDEFIKWYASEGTQDTIIFVDYDLKNEEYNGVSLIEKLKLKNVYLVTGRAEEEWIQKIAEEKKFNLIPKSQLYYLKFILKSDS